MVGQQQWSSLQHGSTMIPSKLFHLSPQLLALHYSPQLIMIYCKLTWCEPPVFLNTIATWTYLSFSFFLFLQLAHSEILDSSIPKCYDDNCINHTKDEVCHVFWKCTTSRAVSFSSLTTAKNTPNKTDYHWWSAWSHLGSQFQSCWKTLPSQLNSIQLNSSKWSWFFAAAGLQHWTICLFSRYNSALEWWNWLVQQFHIQTHWTYSVSGNRGGWW